MREERIHFRQLLALGTVLLLSPALRLFPAASARLAGHGAWLSALLSLVPMLLYGFLLTLALRRRLEGESIFALSLRALGRPLGRAVVLLLALWLLFYAAFILRSGADRLIITIYPDTAPVYFCTVMALLGTVAACCTLPTLVRAAKIVLPGVLGVLLLVLLASFGRVETANLLPLNLDNASGITAGLLPAVDVLAWAVCCGTLTLPVLKKEAGTTRALSLWLAENCGLLFLLSAAIVGSFGPSLASSLSWPFFSLVRNVVLFRSIERIEALVVSLFIFPDFLIVSLFLFSAEEALRLSLGRRQQKSLLLTALCGAAIFALSLLLAPDAAKLQWLSRTLIPALNLAVTFGILPGILLIGIIKKRI